MKKLSHLLVTWIFLSVLLPINGQNPTIIYQDQEEKITDSSTAAFKLEVSSTNTVGLIPYNMVKRYSMSGKKKNWEGGWYNGNHKKFHGKCTWYYANGLRSKEVFFLAGNEIGMTVSWDSLGNKTSSREPENTDQFLSQDELREILKDISEIYDHDFKPDYSSLPILTQIYLELLTEEEPTALVGLGLISHAIALNTGDIASSDIYLLGVMAGLHKMLMLENVQFFATKIMEHCTQGKVKQTSHIYISAINAFALKEIEEGNLIAAKKMFTEILELGKEMGIVGYQINALMQLGNVESLLGKYDHALGNYYKAKEMMDQSENSSIPGLDEIMSHMDSQLGSMLLSANQPQKAAEHFQNMIDQWGWDSKSYEVSYAKNQLFSCYFELGQFDKALELGLKIEQQMDNNTVPFGRVSLTSTIALIYFHQEKYSKAIEWAEKTKRLSLTYEIPEMHAFCYELRGTIESLNGNSKKADSLYSKSNGIRNEKRTEAIHWHVNYSYVNTCINNKEYDRAFRATKETIHHSRRLFRNHTGEMAKLSLQGSVQLAYEQAVYCCYQLEFSDSALFYAEAGKARFLSDLLAETPVVNPNLPQELREEVDSLDLLMRELEHNLNLIQSPAKRKELTHQKAETAAKQRALEARIKKQAPEYAEVRYPEPVQTSDLQNILKSDEILIEYIFGDCYALAIVVGAQHCQVFDLGHPRWIKKLLTEFRSGYLSNTKKSIKKKKDIRISGEAKEQFHRSAHGLYKKLWRPIEKASPFNLENKKIIIVPDNELNYLPFGVLIKDPEVREFNEYDYLIRSTDITYYPSASLLVNERNRSSGKRKYEQDFLGLFTNDYFNNHCAVSVKTGTTPENLSYHEQEQQKIADNFSMDRRTVKSNAEASESFFKMVDLGKYRYIHLFTHALVDTLEPLLSKILLAPGQGEDGCLEQRELYEMSIPAELISLSACETGLGRHAKGEGLTGFSYALRAAGAKSLILTLWEVPENSTSTLFATFWENLAKTNGENKYSSLKKAQLLLINSNAYANPYYWAPFILTGSS